MILPNFMCIGAAKSGTTTLFEILKQHPNIYVPLFKEPRFFDFNESYNKGIDWYSDTYYSNVKEEYTIGDFTPSYFFNKDTPQRIYKHLNNNIKFIVILRNPVDRAYSHYLHTLRDEREKLTFKDAIKKEQSRMIKYEQKMDYVNILRHSYISQGMYGKLLQRYLEHYKLEHFLILHFEEDFLLNRKKTIKRVFEFLEIPNNDNININILANKASKARFKTIKKLMQKKGLWRNSLKNIIPHQIIQIVKNNIQKYNTVEYNPPKLKAEYRKFLMEEHFNSDILILESIIKRKMNW